MNAEGNEQFQEAARSYYRVILRLFVVWGLQDADASDLTHDVFLRATYWIQKKHEIPGIKWLLKVAYSRFVDFCRAASRRRTKVVQEFPRDLQDKTHAATGPLAQTVLRETRECVWLEVARLPRELRELIEYRLQGLTHEQIGKKIGRNKRTVLRKLNRAHRELREVLMKCQ